MRLLAAARRLKIQQQKIMLLKAQNEKSFLSKEVGVVRLNQRIHLLPWKKMMELQPLEGALL
jgi:hypothetical protein